MGQGPLFDVSPFLSQDEGQHFDRKSLFHGPPGEKKPRDRRAVRDEVARYVAGFANAEGGVLILGIEDDHTITGHRLPPKALESLLAMPQARLQPPQPPGFVVSVEGNELVVFDVPSAGGPVQVTGDGFPCASAIRPSRPVKARSRRSSSRAWWRATKAGPLS